MVVNSRDIIGIYFLLLFGFAKSSNKCSTCKGITDKFGEGLKKTAKANFGGGNTKWEEKSLGKYATSETRLVEIVDNLCDRDTKECHTMVEKYEELVEMFWFNHYAKKKDTDFYLWLCIDNINVCCPKNTFGPSCKQCPGETTRPCKDNGNCDGEGTREGTGKCNCHDGYHGDLCDECKDGFFEESKNDTHTKCTACHISCKTTCWEAGPKGCDECKNGWDQTEEEGCKDINECETGAATCAHGQYCSNSEGSYNCATCHKVCDGCTTYGVDKCDKCAEGYTKEGDTCTDVDECLLEDICEDENKQCINKDGSFNCNCKEGFIEEDNKCIVKPKDMPKKKDPSPSKMKDRSPSKKKDQSPSKKKSSSKDKKSSKTKQKYKQPSLLFHFTVLGLYALSGILVKGNVFIVSILTGCLGVYIYWFAL